MKRLFLIISFLNLAFTSNAQHVPANIADSLQSILDNFLVSDTVPGGIIGIHHRTDNWTWKGQSGLANVNTLTPSDTTFSYRIGSVSKNFMAATILHISDRGILSLNDTIGQWLDSGLLDNIPYSQFITIRSLLNHSSGMYNYTDDPAFQVTLLTDSNASFTTDELISIAISHPPNFVPLSSWLYNNTGYVLLTKIIQSATGMSYSKYATDSILIPLGLSNTYYPDTNIILTGHMRCYTDYNNDYIYEDYTDLPTTWATGAGEIVSNLDDQIAYFNALLDGNIISSTGYANMRTPLTGGSVSYGLGMYILDSIIIGHSGQYFSTTGLWYFEDVDVVIAYQFNLQGVDDINIIIQQIHNLLLSQSLGIDQNKTEEVSIYPNPATSNIIIELKNNSEKRNTISIYSVLGQKIKTIKTNDSKIDMDICDLKKGIYLIVITNENKRLMTKKLIKE